MMTILILIMILHLLSLFPLGASATSFRSAAGYDERYDGIEMTLSVKGRLLLFQNWNSLIRGAFFSLAGEDFRKNGNVRLSGDGSNAATPGA
jgi:hypothetical protein